MPLPRASGDTIYIMHAYGSVTSCNVHVGLTWTANQSGLVTLKFDLLTLKVVSESRVMWATSVRILVLLGLSVLDLGPMYETDRRQTSSDVRRASSLNASALTGRGHN